MSGRPQFSEEDKARVYVALATNDGNIKRTARETGIAETTVRRWKKEFETSPPNVDVIVEEAGDFLEKAERVQWKAITTLEKKIEGASPRDLITVIGVLNDKITRARGVADRTVVHEHHLPPADEIRGVLEGLAAGAVDATRQRQYDIVEVDLREQPALPSGLSRP